MDGLVPLVGILVDRAGHRVVIIVGICVLAVALVTAAIGSSTTGRMPLTVVVIRGWIARWRESRTSKDLQLDRIACLS